jgi:hypothetical protein
MVYDFSLMQDGDTLPRGAVQCAALMSDVSRAGGDIEMTLAAGFVAPGTKAERFPEPITNPPAVSGGVAGSIDWTQIVLAPTEAEQLENVRIGMVASPAQIKVTLYDLGLLETVQALVDADPRAGIIWGEALDIRRTNPLIAALSGGGFTPTQIDDIFVYAQSLVI